MHPRLSPEPLHYAVAKALLGPRSVHVLGQRIAATLDDDVPWAFALAARWLNEGPRELTRIAIWLQAFEPLERWLDAHPEGVESAVAWERIRPRIPTSVVLPEFPDVGALASWLGWSPWQLEGHADLRDWHRRQPRFRDYLYSWRGTQTGRRLIEAPKDRLKHAQRKLYRQLLVHLKVHPSAHGFVPGRSVHSHAVRHAGQPWVLRMDLRSFFGSVRGARVRGVFRSLGYPEPIAGLLTGLTTTRTPPDVTRDLPWRMPHLPQGAPTSPALANAVAWTLDRRLHGLAVASGLVYSRYADDLTFSGPRPSRALRALIGRIVEEEGFALNVAKTRLQGPGRAQRVTGLVVNVRPGVPRAERDLLRAILHRVRTQGWDAVRLDGIEDVQAWVEGRVSWVRAANPAHLRRLGGVPGCVERVAPGR